MAFNLEKMKEYISDNYKTNYFETLDYLDKNKEFLNKSNFISLMKKLYFSDSYNYSNIHIKGYAKYFGLTFKEVSICEGSLFDDEKNDKLPYHSIFLDFLIDKKIDMNLKDNFIKNKSISDEYWYNVVKHSIQYGKLEDVEIYIREYINPKTYSFKDKKSFYNLIIEGKQIYSTINKNTLSRYITILMNLGFDINEKDESGKIPLYSAIKSKEKKYILSIIKHKPQCDFFIEGIHLWEYYLIKFDYSEYNHTVYNYFLNNTSKESLECYDGKYYLAGKILSKSACDIYTRKLLRKVFDFYNNRNSHDTVSIRERLLNHSRLKNMFIEEESLYLKNRFASIIASKNKDKSSSFIKKTRV